MAGTWIKMRSDLGTDPAVIRIGTATGLDPFAVVGRLHALWAWADAHTANGTVPGVTSAWIDRLVCHTGFAQALVEAGWLAERNGSVEFPKFARHMGETAKARAAAASRQRVSRSKRVSRPRHTPVTDVSHESVTREEKRRVEEIREDRPPLPPAGGESVGPPVPAVVFDPLRAEQDARKEFERRWAAAGLRKFSRLSHTLHNDLAALLRDGWWAEHYPAALARAGTIPFLATGAGRQKGALDVSEFLRDPDMVRKIIDGVYDPAPPAGGAARGSRREADIDAAFREAEARRRAG